ncbi:hypothetical protein HZ994_11220 [Akkermansiaceae bacterium]|nr:hypothetical protein HZ994_11220 [Akkermansiaceae bacterium]
MALAAYNRLNQITEIYDRFSAEQKAWIMRDPYPCWKRDRDIPGRQAIIGRLLLEGDDDLVWDTFQKIDPPDLADATLRPVLVKLLSHPNHRIKSRAEDYIEVIDCSTNQKKSLTSRGAPTGHKLFNFISTSFQSRRWAHIKR